jgi:hypothetical protein
MTVQSFCRPPEMSGQILRLPQQAVEGPARAGASLAAIWTGRLQEVVCRLLNRLGVPGAIQEATIDDHLTGQQVSVHVGTLFTRISVNGRDYYFHRLSGKFDGTGLGCR